MFVLTDDEIRELRALFASPEWPGYRKAAKKYHVSRMAVWDAINYGTERSRRVK